jgi:hypothetical protein
MSFENVKEAKTVEKECINEGIAIIKQVGDTVVICDDKLKAF